MFSWLPFSLVRVVIFFITGILLGVYLPHSIPLSFASIAFTSLVFLSIVITYARYKGKLSSINPGSFALIAIVLAGYLHLYFSTEKNWSSHFGNANDTISFYKVVINEQPVEKQNSWRVEGKVLALKFTDNGWTEQGGRINLYFAKVKFPQPFMYGDVLLIKGSPQLLLEPSNPGEFDYKRFLSFNNIYHQHFLKGNEVVRITNTPPNIIVHYSLQIRNWAKETLLQFVDGANERAVVSALVLGIKDGLDNELIDAYSSTGALHVLAVSGLHVGIVYALLLFILKPFNKTHIGKWFIAGIGILVLWSYAFITGLSPSVLRAVSMFSFVALAQPLQNRTNIYNTLAASAFCLLLWDPYLIMSVGFQLSFLAVLGIVYIQPKIYYAWSPTNYVLHKVWEISSVSIAAQASTFLLGLLYFHQFPVYFLLSNLFVIPGSTLILIMGIGLLIVSFLYPLALIFGTILNGLLWLLNFLVFQVEKLPFSLIEDIYISTPQCWFLMLILLALFYMIEYRDARIVTLIVICSVLFAGVQWQRHVNEVAKRQFVVYKVPGHSAIEFIENGNSYFYTDSILTKNKDRTRFHIRPNRLRSGVHHTTLNDENLIADFSGFRILKWKELTVLHVYDKNVILPTKMRVDYLIVSNNALSNWNLIPGITCNKLVLDSSNSLYFADVMVKKLHNLVSIHSVLHQGAFKLVL